MKFRKVDDIDPTVCTVHLWEWEGEKRGEVIYPTKKEGEELTTSVLPQKGEISAKQAVESAVWLLEGKRIPIVVFDPDGVWEEEWGELS